VVTKKHRFVVLNPTEEDIQLLLAAQVHIGTKNANTRMAPYIHKRRADGKMAAAVGNGMDCMKS